MKKILRDRLNHLQSNLKELKTPKLTKRIDELEVLNLNTRIDEIKFLLNKIENDS
jgi:hypothetical protein